MAVFLVLLLLSCCCTMMRILLNTLRMGVNTRTPTCKAKRLCPPVLWGCNYPALIANTNISPQSYFPLKVVNTLHKHFYWHGDAVGAQVSWDPVRDVGGSRKYLSPYFKRRRLHLSLSRTLRQFTDTESIWRIPTTTPRFRNLFNVPPPTPGIPQFPTSLSVLAGRSPSPDQTWPLTH